MSKIPYGNALLDDIYDDDSQYPLGAETEDETGREYVFVKFNKGVGNVTCVKGMLLYGLDSVYPAFEATPDGNSTGGSPVTIAIPNRPIGLAQAVLTDGKYGWAQKTGLNRQIVYTDGSITQGMILFGTTDDGTVSGHANPGNATYTIVGTALEADNASNQIPIGQAFINIL